MFTRTSIGVYGRQHRHRDKVLVANITTETSDYWVGPDVSTLVISLYSYHNDSHKEI